MILVLGGDGFVGSAYVRYLSHLGRNVISINRTNYDDYIGVNCDLLINANGNSRKFLSKENPKTDFLASVASVRNSLVDFNYSKYVFLSTSDVYPDCSQMHSTKESSEIDCRNQSPYGFHKYLAELCVQHVAKDWLIIRQGGFVGDGLKKNSVFDVLYSDKVWVNPQSRFQFINTDHSASLVMKLIKKGISNEIFNLTSTETISVSEIMDLVGRYPSCDPTQPNVTYEISTEKVSNLIKLPTSHDSVVEFLASIDCLPQ
jgi:nucleoside-diphosphate-sugar epimerase